MANQSQAKKKGTGRGKHVANENEYQDRILPTGFIHPIADNDINQLIDGNILTGQQVCRSDAIFSHDLRRQLFGLAFAEEL